jgi:hypothetical protein
MGYVETNVRAFTAGTAIGANLRVINSGGKLALAGITAGPTTELGTLEEAAFADGDVVGVRLRNAKGTRLMVADGKIDLHDPVYTADNGKISETGASTSYLRGIALEAAVTDGDIIEVMDVWPMVAES